MIVDPVALAFCQAVIGKAHSPKGRGPDTWSCQGLTEACQREVFGRVLQIADVDEADLMAIARAIKLHPVHSEWPVIAGLPQHGDVVFMARRDTPHHVGTYLDLDRGGILHSTAQEGVCFDPVAMIPFKGWSRLTCHRPVTP